MRKILLTLGLLVALAMAVTPTASAQTPTNGFKWAWIWAEYEYVIASGAIPNVTSWAADCNPSGYYTPNVYPCYLNVNTTSGGYSYSFNVKDWGATSMFDPDGPWTWQGTGYNYYQWRGAACSGGAWAMQGKYKNGVNEPVRNFRDTFCD